MSTLKTLPHGRRPAVHSSFPSKPRLALPLLAAALLLWGAAEARAQGFAGGAGTEDDPYLVATPEHLDNVRNHLDAHFLMTEDIDLGVPPWNEGEGWVPIGTKDTSAPPAELGFSGRFDGGGHAVRNLFIDRVGEDFIGLFGHVEAEGRILGLGIEGGTVAGGTEWGEGSGPSPVGGYVGALAGSNLGQVEGCHSTASVHGVGQDIGGLVGENAGTVADCYATGEVSAEKSGSARLGGLVGANEGTLQHSYATGAVSGGEDVWDVGGLAGVNLGVVEHCHAAGTVETDQYHVGGLVGRNEGGVEHCYATGRVQGGHYGVGGLVGRNDGEVQHCHATGRVKGGTHVGGLAGQNLGGVEHCYATGQVEGGDGVGGLLGFGSGDGIKHCHATGRVEGRNTVGGLVALSAAPIEHSYATGAVSGQGVYVGGLVGRNGGDINHCHATGRVEGGNEAGGLVGRNNAPVWHSFATGAVSGENQVGGLVGRNGSRVEQCYATGAVVGWDRVGGLVGDNNGVVTRAYATGAVEGSERVGGLAGLNHGNVSECYSTGAVSGYEHVGGLMGFSGSDLVHRSFWDIETSGQPSSIGGTGLMTAQMMQRATFEAEGWDFAEMWTITEGVSYPTLRSLPPPPPVASIVLPVRSGTLAEGDTLRFAGSEAPGEGATYLWDFGDGRTAIGRSPGLVRFDDPGFFEVTYSKRLPHWDDPATDAREFAVVEDTGDLPDLQVESVDVPGTLALGEPEPIAYAVRNVGHGPAGPPWEDALYLSRSPHLDASATLLAAATVDEALPAGAAYQNVLQATLPLGMEEGAYYLILSSDDGWQVLDRRRLNNQRAAAVDALLPRLEDGAHRTVPHPRGHFENQFYLQLPPGGEHLLLTFEAGQPGFEFLVRHGQAPTRGVYDYRSTGGELLVPSAPAGDWHVLVVGRNVPDAGEYTLGYETLALGLGLSSASPGSSTVFRNLALTLAGTGFFAPVAVDLVAQDGTAYGPQSVSVDSTTRLTAHFPAGTLPAGVYAARVVRNGEVATIPNAAELLAEGEPNFEAHLILPQRFGYHIHATVYVEYANTGNAPMPAPLLMVTATQNGRQAAILSMDEWRVQKGFWTAGLPLGFRHAAMFLASGESLGILQPGESRRVPVYYAGWLLPWDFSYPPLNWELGILEAGNEELANWDAMKGELKPHYVREDAWDAVWANFTDLAGETWGDYVAMLARNAAYLDRVGKRVDDLPSLLAFSMRLADGMSPLNLLDEAADAGVQGPGMPILFERMYMQPISRRFELGPLGRGWAHSWQYTAEELEDGTLRVADWTGTPRTFQPDSRYHGRFIAQPGDAADMRAADGGQRLTEPDGTVLFFRDGKLEYVEDTNGNRITCEYAQGRLDRLVHSAGGYLEFAYADGRIVSVADHHGRQTLYSYDGEHLTGVQTHDGRDFTYEYRTDPGPARHALTAINRPDGTVRSFDYDGKGRLSATWRGDREEEVTFSHGQTGQIVATDALGNIERFFFDHWARLAKAENPLGETVLLGYDRAGNLTSYTDAEGMTTSFSYDVRNNLSTIRDAAGNTTELLYTPRLNRLALTRDARGKRTRYGYDDKGNLASITYEDGSAETWTHDAQGNPASWTNRRGRTVNYSFDAAGRLVGKAFEDGTSAEFRGDARGNLAEAENALGTTAFTHDENDFLVRIDYPQGRWLEFAYDAAGRRSSSEDQLGRRVDYHYDDAGRLSRLSEGGEDIVAYAYDALGRLARQDMGNGMSAEYSFDAAGRLLSLVNRGPDGETLSAFSYTYDRRGRRTGVKSWFKVDTF